MTPRVRRTRLTWRLLRRRGPLAWAIVLGVVLVLVWWQHRAEGPHPPEVLTEGPHQVQRVIDGDTLLLANGARVRLIGADTPETVQPNHPVEPWGPEASEFTRQFVEGREVWLEFDRERVDRYGRFLAYVWVGDRMLNEELIRSGLARANLTYRYAQSKKNRFRRAEQEARSAGRGIWSTPHPQNQAA